MVNGIICPQGVCRFTVGCAVLLGVYGASGLAQGTTTDYTGDGRADFAVVTNVSGSYVYWVADANTSDFFAKTWGMTGDHTVGGDFDGDGKVDVTVWRPAFGGGGGYWVQRSSTGQAAFIPFGSTGDNARVIGDYDGDGKTDGAVLRTFPSGGRGGVQPAYWYHRRSSDDAIVGEQWGMGDNIFAAPGDYDGDGRNDLALQTFSGSNAIFFIKYSSSSGFDAVHFGTVNDLVVPGDYDGDGKTDVAIARQQSGIMTWWVRRSSNGTLMSQTWGMTGDRAAHGDYDGDGKTDIAIWRPSTREFWVSKSTGGVLMRHWGVTSSDFPVAFANAF
jgi:spore coat protein A, manganese oxidase